MSEPTVPLEQQLVGETDHFDLPDVAIDVDAQMQEDGVVPTFLVSEHDIAPTSPLAPTDEQDDEQPDDDGDVDEDEEVAP
ncbi:hypothetical protein OVA14_07270 [Agrococcus sp. SL85]|uniref:hypothetical protein n=1 Tax=Agrococcus sp. SL85 TaxID=2995141 RepID=UPI00226C785D|nr:hypothetical protein [Agrococcus sp. SL85]WAC65193.1 hypothetical protein OVA14_07270 [Agrococcus sp. SL85]